MAPTATSPQVQGCGRGGTTVDGAVGAGEDTFFAGRFVTDELPVPDMARGRDGEGEEYLRSGE